jgi:hypothetical protein
MFDRIVNLIRQRSRQEWQEYFRKRIDGVREYAQTNGEKAAIIAFLLGISLIVFFKFALVLGCLAVVGYQLVLIVAEEP